MSSEVCPASLLQKYNVPVPRYTSYPPAHAWKNVSEVDYISSLKKIQHKDPVGIYIHIPFCKTMCSYCGCHTRSNSSSLVEETYVKSLCKEIELLHEKNESYRISNVHFGGGTPTKLSNEQLSRIVQKLSILHKSPESIEYAIEVDPRTAYLDTDKLPHLKSLGFSRISLGIQDFDAKVQIAIGRNQHQSISIAVYEQCRRLGFFSIHFDLVYGLPLQTPQSFHETIRKVLQLKPDRIALFSFAYIPALKSNQTGIPVEYLPSEQEKFSILCNAKKQLIEGGYYPIGMDHFALKSDPLYQCQKNRCLFRNFQGYTQFSNEVIGLGESAISSLRDGFFQNFKSLPEYTESLNQRRLPTNKGKILSAEDRLRAFTINQLMCHFYLDKKKFFYKFRQKFDYIFRIENTQLMMLSSDGLLDCTSDYISVHEIGKFFIRNIAAIFDRYDSSRNASRAI